MATQATHRRDWMVKAASCCPLFGYCANLYHQLSEVLSFKQPDEGIGSTLETLHYILAIFDPSCGEPFRHLLLKFAEMRTVIVKYDESLHAYATLQQSTHDLWSMISSRGGLAVVVVCDQAAEGNARARIEQGENSLKYQPPYAFKIHIYTLRAGF